MPTHRPFAASEHQVTPIKNCVSTYAVSAADALKSAHGGSYVWDEWDLPGDGGSYPGLRANVSPKYADNYKCYINAGGGVSTTRPTAWGSPPAEEG